MKNSGFLPCLNMYTGKVLNYDTITIILTVINNTLCARN